jgi:hypothetical protein
VKKLDDKLNNLFSRRSFLAGAGTTAAAAMVVGCSNNSNINPTPPATTLAFTDADILNYALNLEYLEAEFYLRAATGSGLAAADIGSSPGAVTTTGNITVQAVPALPAAQQNILNEIAFEEQQHVRLLRAALGASAVARPAIDLTFFSTLANVAGVTAGGSTVLPVSGATAFSPFTSFDAFLIGSFIFEDVGVTAYAGGATLITSAENLLAAAGVLATEAYHAAYVRTTITGRAIAAAAAGTAYPYLTIANQVEALRATLTVGQASAPSTSGSVETKLILPSSATTPSAIVAADSTNAIGFARTTSQVHHIVYGSATLGVSKGGFFPNGTNSIFSTAN